MVINGNDALIFGFTLKWYDCRLLAHLCPKESGLTSWAGQFCLTCHWGLGSWWDGQNGLTVPAGGSVGMMEHEHGASAWRPVLRANWVCHLTACGLGPNCLTSLGLAFLSCEWEMRSRRGGCPTFLLWLAPNSWESQGHRGLAQCRFHFVCFTVTDCFVLVVDQVCPSLFYLGKQNSRFFPETCRCAVQSSSASTCLGLMLGQPLEVRPPVGYLVFSHDSLASALPQCSRERVTGSLLILALRRLSGKELFHSLDCWHEKPSPLCLFP